MRVISGRARGTTLNALDGLHTRPTTDRVKEAMFSIINFYIDSSVVLDLFSGSGALGIETLSRGAKRCFFVENNKSALEIIKKNVEKTKLSNSAEIVFSDYETFLKNTRETFDVILLDPPYNKKMCDRAMSLIYEKNLLNDDGIIVCETEYPENIETKFIKRKDYKYGKTKLTVFIKGD